MTSLEMIVGQICTARGYTVSLLDGLDEADWFRQPSDGVTHVAWQAGHIASAEYYLTMVRIRGRTSEDAELISDGFLEQFGRGSVPEPDAAKYPSPGEIRRVMDAVHQRFLGESKQFTESLLAEPTEPPHPMFSTKQGALSFCPMHEMIHAGQIGLVRRLLGHKPLR